MRRLVLSCVVLIVLGSVVHAAGWTKFVAADKSFSFHYPEGWKTKSDGSVIEITNAAAQEQLLVIALPFDPLQSARQHAETMLGMLKQQMPDLMAAGWSAGNDGDTVTCEVTYTEDGKPFRGDVLAVKSDKDAAWFSYSAPSNGYSRARALGLLEGLVQSISGGTGSVPPAAAPPGLLEGKARAFVFVLEFALGFPFTAQQERLVLDELLSGWSTASAEELKKYDAYPGLAKAITALTQKQLAETQQELGHTTREWLQTAPKTDPVVAMINKQLAEKGKTLAAGTPALTVMSARAYSELMGYAELLQKQPGATPEQVKPEVVANIQRSLVKEWPKLSKAQREQVRGTPGLWLVLRSQMEQGTAADRQQVRTMLAKLAPKPAAPAKPAASAAKPTKPSSSPGGSRAPMSMTQHWCLMQMQQQSFNTWQWSMGYKSTMMGY